MSNSKKIGLYALTALLIGAGAFWFFAKDTHPDGLKGGSSKGDLIEVYGISEGDLVYSPLQVSGRARGYWYFEASFPTRMFDANGLELGVAITQAQGEWMTEEYVPFSTTLTFMTPSTDIGFLVLQKDNPSGLPEHDDELRIPVRFK